ncbi:MAG: DMT family transporter [Roseovarius sp.]
MPSAPLFAAILIAVCGSFIAMQAPINAALGRSIDSTLAAATISFGVGFLILLVISIVHGDGPALARAPFVSKYLLIGGALGAVYVWSALWAVPILGVLTTTTALILGQMVAALLIDHFGAFGLAPRDVSAQRVIAALLVAAGAVLSRY